MIYRIRKISALALVYLLCVPAPDAMPVTLIHQTDYRAGAEKPSGSPLTPSGVLPVVTAQPQDQAVLAGGNVVFSVEVAAAANNALLPTVNSGQLALWLRADAGTVTNGAGLVSQWQDQSGNGNDAMQGNINNQPLLLWAGGLGVGGGYGAPAIRFNNAEDSDASPWLHGTNSVGVSNAMTSFVMYYCYPNASTEDLLWYIGVPGFPGAGRSDDIYNGDMNFSTWDNFYTAPYLIASNTYGVWVDRLDTNLTTLEMFDITTTNETNFSMPLAATFAPGAGYYVGGLDASLPGVETSRVHYGDILEWIVYRGYLSDSDRLAVISYFQQKYLQGNVSFQWQYDGTNIAGASNAALRLTNVQSSTAGSYSVTMSNLAGSVISSNAVLAVAYPPSITSQPQSLEVVQESNVSFAVGITGTGPIAIQWYLYGRALPQATNATLSISNAQPASAGAYWAAVTSPFGSVASSYALLRVDTVPMILMQPQGQAVLAGTDVLLTVEASGVSIGATVPGISSGQLALWLEADTGTVTNGIGLVSQWQDQSGNGNDAMQASTNNQPLLTSAAGLNGRAVIRFNGNQNSAVSSWLQGANSVGVPGAMTSFVVYNAFSTTNTENLLWYIGVPGNFGTGRTDDIDNGDLNFSTWGHLYTTPYVIPTNTYRIWVDRLDTNLTTLEMFDITATNVNYFTMAATGTSAPGAGYYVGGLDASLPYVGTSRDFNGDIAEWIVYSGYLSETDRLAVVNYIQEKYFEDEGGLSYQWQLDGTNITGATNATLRLTNVQTSTAGSYSVTMSNLAGSVISSNAVLTVDYPPSITSQPQSLEVGQGSNVSFTVEAVAGTGPFVIQWYYNGQAVSQATNATLLIPNAQPTSAGSYWAVITSPFGNVVSSNALLTVDTKPIILTQPESQTVLVATNVVLTVGVANNGMAPALPSISSGQLALWLKADTGVLTNGTGLVNQWQDQSGNGNDAMQSGANNQPALAWDTGLDGRAAVRFNGDQNSAVSSWLHGVKSVGVSNAMTSFVVYNAFSSTNVGNLLWFIGVPGAFGASRTDYLDNDDMNFSTWFYVYAAPYAIPTNTYRIWVDRLDTNLTTLDSFDITTTDVTNFSTAVSGAQFPAAGYYVGGLDVSVSEVGTSRDFYGDIAEWIVYNGYLGEADRLAVVSYLQEKYLQGGISYQWQLNETNIADATNATLTLTNVQISNDGAYSVIVRNGLAGAVSSNAVLAVGYPPSITQQPMSLEVVQGSNASFSLEIAGTAPIAVQWYFNGQALPQATSATLLIPNAQPASGGSYWAVMTSLFGSVTSSNAFLTVDGPPIIAAQPANQALPVGTNGLFTVGVANAEGGSGLPPVSSGSLTLWLKADTGVVASGEGLVGQWQDQSGNTNDATQTGTNNQPLLVSAAGLNGKAAIRFSGNQNGAVSPWLQGTNSVGVSNAMTSFLVYSAFSTTNTENLLWYVGVPGYSGAGRTDDIDNGDLNFSTWYYVYTAPYVIPTNTYRIWVDRLDTNLTTLEMFDITTANVTNFSMALAGTSAPGAGYYVGGLNGALTASRDFNGDIAEWIVYSGYLSEADRLAVVSYLQQCYFQAGEGGSVSYQWQFDGTNIVGATNATLTFTNLQISNDGSYSVVLSNDVGIVVSSNALLTVYYPPLIASQPQSLEVFEGSNASVTVGTAGTGPIAIQWYFNGQPLWQATNATLLISNIQPTNAGAYSAVATSPIGSVTSSTAFITVDSPPIITIQPQSQTVVAGTNVVFTVGVANTGGISALPTVTSGSLRVWLKADAGVVTNEAGLVSQWLDQSGNTNNAAPRNSNQQPSLEVSGGLGNKPVVRFNGISGNDSYLYGPGTVGVPTAITVFTVYNAFSTDPGNILWDIGTSLITSGSRISYFLDGDEAFSVGDFNYTYAAPLAILTNTYRLRIDRLNTNLNTVNIYDVTATESTNFTFSVSQAVTPTAGYYLGSVGVDQSFDGDIAEWIVYSGYLSEGDRLAVVDYLQQKYFQAEGGGNVSYQWEFDGTYIAGATNSTLELTNVQFSNDGSYSVAMSNEVGSSVSSNVVLAVGYPLLITSQPQSLEVAQGSNLSFTVGVGGTGPVAIQWYFYGRALSQETNSTLVISNAQPTSAGSYWAQVTSPFGSVVSSNALLTVDATPIILMEPQSQVVMAGTSAVLTAEANGVFVGVALPQVSSGQLALWLRADTGVVTNGAGLVSQWQDQSGNCNDAMQASTNNQPLLVSATGLNGKPAIRFSGDQNSAVSSWLQGTNSVGVSNALTSFVVYNAFSTINPENLLWLIGAPGAYGASRTDDIYNSDMNFSTWFYVYTAPNAIPTNTYRIWVDRLDANLTTLNMFDITTTNVTNFTMTVSKAAAPGAGYYVGGLEGGTSRDFDGEIAEWIVYREYLSEADRLAVVSYLEQMHFQNGFNYQYQWQCNGTNIAGATNATLILANVQLANDGNYNVIISDLAGSVGSSNALLTVYYPPSITLQPQNMEVLQGGNASFTVGSAGTGPTEIQWYFDGQATVLGTNATLLISNVQPGNVGSYWAVVTTPFGSVTSSNAFLAVDTTPTITVQPQNQTVPAGVNVVLTVEAAGVTLPSVESGQLALWLKADTGVVASEGGLVSRWQDQSGNGNDATQTSTNNQPLLVSAVGLNGKAAIRFSGNQNGAVSPWLQGTASVGVPNAMTSFVLYNAFSTTNPENLLWYIGVPGYFDEGRTDDIYQQDMDFSTWGNIYAAQYIIPTNSYRIWTDRLDTNLTTLDMFDITTTNMTNFSMALSGADTPGAGYYVGGLDASAQFAGSSRDFDGDIAEWIVYSGYLSDTDRLTVAGYLLQKYFNGGVDTSLTYQWLNGGITMADATNSTLTLTNVQLTNAGLYSVIVSDGVAYTVSSNALLTVESPPVIVVQPPDRKTTMPGGTVFEVAVTGEPMPSIQWRINGTNIAGGTNEILSIPSAVPGDGGSYSVVASNFLGMAVSSNALLTVNYLTATGAGQPEQIAVSNLTVPSSMQPQNSFVVSAVDLVSAEGGSMQLTNGVIVYTPPPGFAGEDGFSYLLTAATGPAEMETVSVLVDACLAAGGSVNGEQVTVRFVGTPGMTYTIEVSTDLRNWVPIDSATAGVDGRFEFRDANTSQYTDRFYRTAVP